MFNKDIIIQITNNKNYHNILDLLVDKYNYNVDKTLTVLFMTDCYIYLHGNIISIFFFLSNEDDKFKIISDKEFLRKYKIENFIYKNKIK